jgi:integrase
MPRTIVDAKLETRASRQRLAPSKKPYWKTLIPRKLHLGYRKKRKEQSGIWLMREYLGGERYRVAPLGLADDYTEPNAKNLVFSFSDAQKIAYERRLQIETGPKDELTVAGAIAAYVTWMKLHRATGHEVARRAELHILPTLGKLKVSDLTTAQLNNWRDALAEAPALLRSKVGTKHNARPYPNTEEQRRARRATANKVVTILKAALNHSFNNDLIADDSAWRKFKSFRNVSSARSGYLTVSEAQRLINAADALSGFHDLLHAALLTGCRYGELCRLRVRDFANGKLAIQKSKTGKPRHVRLTDEGRKFFEQLTVGRDCDEWLLINRRLGREWRKSEQARPMRNACVRAKIPPLGIHQMRHTYASLAVMGGVPLIVVADNLGHKDTRMVEKHYGHLTDDFKDKAIRECAPRFCAVKLNNITAMRP